MAVIGVLATLIGFDSSQHPGSYILQRKAITKPPTKRSRSEGPVSRTRREEAVSREELKKDEAQSCQSCGQRAVVMDPLVHALNKNSLSYVTFGESEKLYGHIGLNLSRLNLSQLHIDMK